MSKVAINRFYNELDRTIQFGGSRNEESVRANFFNLLKTYAKDYHYEAIAEIRVLGTKGKKVKPDGVINQTRGLTIGLWESKDEKDDLDAEIDAKIRKGYPLENILFEDTQTAILYQYGEEVERVPVRDADKLDRILKTFFEFKSDTVLRFEAAIDRFEGDLPEICDTLRKQIIETREKNREFQKAQQDFFELCQAEINPDITIEDIREMMIQHILTSDIFNKIFDDSSFHRHNTIAAALEELIEKLFSYSERRNLLMSIEHFYEEVNATAAGIVDHHQKQKFLKAFYEDFYKVYNPKAADRLGVVYTPNEIVQFMVRSADFLLHKHFRKTLADDNVEILDPATGTGTFICDIVEYIPKQYLEYKYKNEIHANEVAILPYYIANLNIEYTYKQKMGSYAEYRNLCFVDTLDNIGGLDYEGKQELLFGLSSENTERIRRQNAKKISVIIGNPPYNANQLNENENNKNREYPDIDKRIKDTFVNYSTAQKTKVYDMYARFYRWAMDRIDRNGVIAFITNNSFVDARTFDGFRKCVQDEFDFAYVINLGGNIRELSGKDGIFLNEEHTIFGVSAAVGIAIMFLVKKQNKDESPCKIEYIHPCDIRATRIEKFEWLKSHSFGKIEFVAIHPSKKNYWINLAEDNDWEELIPIASKDVKLGRGGEAIFELFSLGVVTARDEWVYDDDENVLEEKVNFLIDIYNQDLLRLKGKTKGEIKDEVDYTIKWTRAVKNDLSKGKEYSFDNNLIIESMYRPFRKKKLYFSKELNEMQYQMPRVYQKDNIAIAFSGEGSSKPFQILIQPMVYSHDMLEKTQCLPLYRYDSDGTRHENITDWAMEEFVVHYDDLDISKEDIFHYVYGVLHNPAYREKYEINLKREFPRIPFYEDFWRWAKWGEELMKLHIEYETVEPFGLKRVDEEIDHNLELKVKLKADKESGVIVLDEQTSLYGVPTEAWEYKLGNRSALEWILDQYKEKKPRDETIREKFNTYRFADYKEQVIDLLDRVCTVSVETMRIVGEMKEIAIVEDSAK